MAFPGQTIGWTTSDPRFHNPFLQQLLDAGDFCVVDVLSSTRLVIIFRGIWWVFVIAIAGYSYGTGSIALLFILDQYLRYLIRKRRTLVTNRKNIHLVPSMWFPPGVVLALWARSWEILLKSWVTRKKASANQDSANQVSANQVSANQVSANQVSANQDFANPDSANQNPTTKNRFTRFWWFTYLYVAYPGEFEHNYLAAFNAITPEGAKRLDVVVFLKYEYLSFRFEGREQDMTDQVLLKEIRMRYRLLKLRNGLTELLVPKRLRSIHCVEFDKDSHALGQRIATLDLGPGRGILWFHHPEAAKSSTNKPSRKIIDMASEGALGLELCRSIDKKAIATVALVSPIAATTFAAIWVAVYVARGDDVQAVVAAAFTVATYIFTVGTLVIALVGLLDKQSEEGMAQNARRRMTTEPTIPPPGAASSSAHITGLPTLARLPANGDGDANDVLDLQGGKEQPTTNVAAPEMTHHHKADSIVNGTFHEHQQLLAPTDPMISPMSAFPPAQTVPSDTTQGHNPADKATTDSTGHSHHVTVHEESTARPQSLRGSTPVKESAKSTFWTLMKRSLYNRSMPVTNEGNV